MDTLLRGRKIDILPNESRPIFIKGGINLLGLSEATESSDGPPIVMSTLCERLMEGGSK